MTVHHSSIDLVDEEFVAAFEGAAIPAHAFPHRAHLRVTWLYVRRLGAAEAAQRMANGIRRLAGSHGHPALYHDTLTRAWVRLVAAAASRGNATAFHAFVVEHPELLDKQLPLRYYSASLLWSDEARAQWLEPDLEPLPTPTSGPGERRTDTAGSAGDRLLPWRLASEADTPT